MITSGFMGVYFPFKLFFVGADGNVYYWAGGENVQTTTHGCSYILRSDIGGKILIDSAWNGTNYASTLSWNFNNSIFDLILAGVVVPICFNGTFKVYTTDYEFSSYDRFGNQTGYATNNDTTNRSFVASRDAELLGFHNSGYLQKYNFTTYGWSNVGALASNPGRVQKYGSAYYYASGNQLFNLAGAVATFDHDIIDWYIGAESVVLTSDGLFWLDGSFQGVASLPLSGVTSSSVITAAGTYLAVNLTSKIVVIKGHSQAYEINEATSHVAILSNE